MRHGDKVNNLGRKSNHRHSLLKNLSKALIEHKRINTTLAKAKALRLHIEPLVTKSKDNTTHSRRVAFSYLQSKEAIKELFDVIGPKVMDRPGGYVRIIKTGFRQGDGAETALIELVDFNENFLAAKESKPAKKKTRRSRGKSSSTVQSVVAETPVENTTSEPVAEVQNNDEETQA
ncbi:MAG: 50S ribosomal protein L17 [Saprospiraceae bacterium]|nr:50S ribosomal protein L17 [Saprospiraceae bacterium]